MSITNEMLIKMNEEYIKFLQDKLTTNTPLTDEQYKLMLQIYKLMSEELKTEEEQAEEWAEVIRQMWKYVDTQKEEYDEEDEEEEEEQLKEGDAVVHAYIDRLVDEMLPN